MVNVAINGSEKSKIFGTDMANKKCFYNLKRWML